MTEGKDRCAKCNAKMELGFILEQKNAIVNFPNIWVEGAPEPSFLERTKLSGKVKLSVETYRCVECGYLESYAKK